MIVPFSVQTAHCIEDIGEERWDSLSEGQAFGDYQWYRFCERVLLHEKPYYIVLSCGGKPVARASFWLSRHEPMPVPPGAMRVVVRRAIRTWPLLICRTPLSGLSGIVLPSDATLRQQALNAIDVIIQQYARQHNASFVIYDYIQSHMLSLPGYAQVEVPDAGTALHVEWNSFDEYVASLGKSARKDYRRHSNRAADLGIVMQADATAPDLDTALQLISNVNEKHGSPDIPHLRTVLQEASNVGIIWLKAYIDDKLVGCGTMLGHGGHKSLAFLGLDYDQRYVYFQLFYSAIRTAIETGTSFLYGGSGAYEVKERFGFQQLSNNYSYFAAKSRMIQRIIQRLMAS